MIVINYHGESYAQEISTWHIRLHETWYGYKIDTNEVLSTHGYFPSKRVKAIQIGKHFIVLWESEYV